MPNTPMVNNEIYEEIKDSSAMMAHLLASSAFQGDPKTNGEFLASKTRLASFYVEGAMILPRSGGLESIVVSEEDANFKAKSLLALTILRASFQTAPVLDETQAAEMLRLPKLPSGFYVLSPGHHPKIAAAYLPEIAGAAQKPYEQFMDAMDDLVDSGHVEANAFVTRFVVDAERFAQARDPFADYMSIGSGMLEGPKAQARLAAGNDSLETYGLKIETTTGGGSPLMGYPAPMFIKGQMNRDPYGGKEEEVHFHRLAHIRKDVTITTTVSQMASLSIYNHNAASTINNIRDIQDAINRKGERHKIVHTMVDAWMAREAIAQNPNDQELSMSRLAPNERTRLAQTAADNEVKSFGKARNFFVKQGQTSSFSFENQHLVLSMDQALVDGQHSSRDYALISQGCLNAKQHGGSNLPPTYMGEDIDDCSPEALSETVWNRYLSNWVTHGINPLGFEDGMLKAVAISGEEMDEEAKNDLKTARAQHEKALKQASKKVWSQFSLFAPKIPVDVMISATVDPLMALVYMTMQNASSPQRPEAMAMASHQHMVQHMVSSFNDMARKLGDPIRLSAVKSQHANPDMSTADEPQLLTRDFAELFPYLRAVANAAGTSATSHLKSAQGHATGKMVQAENWAKWEAVAIFDHFGVKMPSVNDQQFKDVVTRLKTLHLAVDTLKSRSFELTSDSLEKTGARLLDTQNVSKRAGILEFAKLGLLFSQRLLRQALARAQGLEFEESPKEARRASIEREADEAFESLAGPESDPQRIYAAGKIALALKDALRPNKRGQHSMRLMNDASLDNIMLALLTTASAVEREDGVIEYAHPASPRALEALRQARGRLELHEEASKHSKLTFNSARENFLSAFTAKEKEVRDSGKPIPAFQRGGLVGVEAKAFAKNRSTLLSMLQAFPGAAELIFDAVPGPGCSWRDIATPKLSNDVEANLPVAAPVDGKIKERLVKSRIEKSSIASPKRGKQAEV